MDSAMIARWNSVVQSNDVVIHLGDFGLGNAGILARIAQQLNGVIYFVMGNHDRGNSAFYKEQCGFEEVYKGEPLIIPSLGAVFSHRPLADSEFDSTLVNVHGHIHNRPLNDDPKYPPELFTASRHINVSADVQHFFPVPLLPLLGRQD